MIQKAEVEGGEEKYQSNIVCCSYQILEYMNGTTPNKEKKHESILIVVRKFMHTAR
jgi:hypothetical protein